MTDVQLLTPEEVLEDYSHLVDSRKHVVKVDRDTFSRLLIDYDVMRNALRGSSSFKVTLPTKRTRAALT